MGLEQDVKVINWNVGRGWPLGLARFPSRSYTRWHNKRNPEDQRPLPEGNNLQNQDIPLVARVVKDADIFFLHEVDGPHQVPILQELLQDHNIYLGDVGNDRYTLAGVRSDKKHEVSTYYTPCEFTNPFTGNRHTVPGIAAKNVVSIIYPVRTTQGEILPVRFDSFKATAGPFWTALKLRQNEVTYVLDRLNEHDGPGVLVGDINIWDVQGNIPLPKWSPIKSIPLPKGMPLWFDRGLYREATEQYGFNDADPNATPTDTLGVMRYDMALAKPGVEGNFDVMNGGPGIGFTGMDHNPIKYKPARFTLTDVE
ncbi:MAG: hypothetical protein KKG59_07095 [Nanoarchaeota archaeon]|nr:hypothetical protein [Nanoarchaeota archaeon]